MCTHDQNLVINSMPGAGAFRIRRRRKCMDCGYRWNTFELDEEELHARELRNSKAVDSVNAVIEAFVQNGFLDRAEPEDDTTTT
jgi:transcriptional regulator NrdR family protein